MIETTQTNGAPPIPPEEADLQQGPEVYRLLPSERMTAAKAIEYENSIKARIYDLQLELGAASARKRGVFAMLLESRGWTDGVLSEDCSTLTRR